MHVHLAVAVCFISPSLISTHAGTISPAPVPLGFIPHPLNLSLSAFVANAIGQFTVFSKSRDKLCTVGGQVPTGVRSQSNECSKWTQNINRQTLVEAPTTHMGNLRYQDCVGVQIPDSHSNTLNKVNTVQAPWRCDSYRPQHWRYQDVASPFFFFTNDYRLKQASMSNVDISLWWKCVWQTFLNDCFVVRIIFQHICSQTQGDFF